MPAPALPPRRVTLAELKSDLRRRMFWFGASFCWALAPMYLGLAVWQGAWLRGALHIAIFGSLLWAMLMARRSGDHRRGLCRLHSITFFGVLAGAFIEPGTQTPWFWWLSVIPFVTLLSRLTWLGIVQGAIVVGYAAFAWVLEIEPVGVSPLRLHLAEVLSTLYVCAYLALALTWQRRLERALDQASDDATATAQQRTRFLAHLGHEIRNPLGALIGANELMRAPDTDEAQRRTLAELQAHSAQALLALVNDALDWCKIDAGRMVLSDEPMDLRELLLDASELFAVQAYAKGIEITASANPDVAPRLRGDPVRLRQVLINLAGNAVKFTAQGGVHLHLSMDGDLATRPGVRIEVADSGIGMDAQQLRTLFQPYVQADASVARRFGGTGLGLAISDELVRRMGGRMEVSSAPGLGSTFTVVLPLAPMADDDAPATSAPRRDVAVVAAGAGLQRHLQSLMQRLGIEAQAVCDLNTLQQLQGCTLVFVDAPLLAGVRDVAGWMQAQAALGRRVVVLAALGTDPLSTAIPGAQRLYKPVRASALGALLAAPAAARERSAPVHAPATPPAPCRVLLCEDDPVNQLVLQAMLVQLGARVTAARDGLEALELLSRERHDLVLMDLDLPQLSGAEAAREWRRLEAAAGFARVPIVAISGATEDALAERLIAADIDAALPKPFGLEALRRCLQRWVPTPAA